MRRLLLFVALLALAVPARAIMNEACEGPDGVMSTAACDQQVQPEFKTHTLAEFAQMTGAPDATTVLEMVHPLTIESGLLPKAGTMVSVDGMVPYQKVDGGYLIHINPTLVTTLEAMGWRAFLKTKQKLSEGQELTGPVKFMGRYEYEAINGFKQSVLAFSGPEKP